jgi:hypothetical protein
MKSASRSGGRRQSRRERRGDGSSDQRLAAWIFGSLLLVFLAALLVLAPDVLPPFKQRLLAVLCALLAGLFAYFLTGRLAVDGGDPSSPWSGWGIRAGGGAAAFVVVLFWWVGPWAPVEAGDGSHRLRVTVLDPQGRPVDDARLHSSLGGEILEADGGWVVSISGERARGAQAVTLRASRPGAFESGEVRVPLDREHDSAVELTLRKRSGAMVGGTVVDEKGETVPGAVVTLDGRPGRTTTDRDGSFEIESPAAAGEMVRLRVRKAGYAAVDRWHLAGAPATLVLRRPK